MNYIKNLILFLVSLLVSVILVLIIVEVVFYFTYGDWYRNKSYLLYKSRLFDHSDGIYPKNMELLHEKYEPIIIQDIPNNFNPEMLQKKILKGRFKENYDLIFSVWIKSNRLNDVKLCIKSGKRVYSSVFIDQNIIKDNFCFFWVTAPFCGKARLWIDNSGFINSCRGLRVFLKRHPYIYNYEKEKGTYRILGIGGSTTASYGGLQFPDTYTFVVQKYFDALWPGRIDILNLGIVGGQTNDYINNINYYLSLKPDMIILAPVWNDAHSLLMGRWLLNKKIASCLNYNDVLKYMQDNLFFSNFALGYYIYKGINIFIYREERKCQASINQCAILKTTINDKNFCSIIFRKRLNYLVSEFIKEGIGVVLVTFPSVSTGVSPTREERKMLDKTLQPGSTNLLKLQDYFMVIDKEVIPSVAINNKIPLIECDKDAVFAQSPYSVRKDYFWDHVHFSPKGSELIGQIIAVKLYKIFKHKIENLS